MAYIYFAVTVKENDHYYAYVVRCSEGDNVCSTLKCIKDLAHANPFKTKKRAAETVKAWNEAYKQNGSHLFDTPAFEVQHHEKRHRKSILRRCSRSDSVDRRQLCRNWLQKSES